MFLESRGCAVASAWDEAAAQALVASETPHAAVLDYCLGMPETLRVADLLASMAIPFLFLTDPLSDAGWGAHADALRLEKPVSPGKLAAAVGELLVGGPTG